MFLFFFFYCVLVFLNSLVNDPQLDSANVVVVKLLAKHGIKFVQPKAATCHGVKVDTQSN